jgi:hypothetical protein
MKYDEEREFGSKHVNFRADSISSWSLSFTWKADMNEEKSLTYWPTTRIIIIYLFIHVFIIYLLT